MIQVHEAPVVLHHWNTFPKVMTCSLSFTHLNNSEIMICILKIIVQTGIHLGCIHNVNLNDLLFLVLLFLFKLQASTTRNYIYV